MTEPTFSIVIPAFNSAGTIGRALDSVYGQSWRDFEVIVVDDGSSDDLENALAPYGERLVLIRQANAGAAAARNTGAKHASGRLLAFLDADDFWHPRKLELQLAAFADRTDVALCWTDALLHSSGEQFGLDGVEIPQHAPIEYSSNFDEIFAKPYLGTPGVVMPRALFDELGGFRHDLKSAEDIDLWLRAAYGRVTARIRARLFVVVTSPHSLTARRMDGTYRDNLRVIEDFCAAHPEFVRAGRRSIRRARAKVLENWASDALIKRNFSFAQQLLLRSLKDRITFRAALLLSKTAIGRLS